VRLSISGIVFLLVGAGLLGWSAGAAHPASRVAGISAGAAFALLGIGYLVSRPALLCKRASGRMHPVSYPLFWPYHLLSYASLVFFRLARVVPFQEILPGLYLGGWLFPWERARLNNLGIASVLDLTCELGEAGFLRDVETYRCIPLLDGTAPTAAQLQSGIDFIRQQLPRGPVYVHCAMGHGRSATVVAGYLMATGAAATLPAAIDLIRARRPGIRLNPAQRRSLEGLKL
jgi:hypothetical protein